MPEPKCVGLWIVGVENDEITKWGLGGGTELPLPPDTGPAVITAEVEFHRKTFPTGRFYIFKVFDINGQIKHSYATKKDA